LKRTAAFDIFVML